MPAAFLSLFSAGFRRTGQSTPARLSFHNSLKIQRVNLPLTVNCDELTID